MSKAPAFSKSHMVNSLVDEFGMTQQKAKQMVGHFFSNIEDALKDGREVRIGKVGTLFTKLYGERKSVSPLSGETSIIPAHTAVAFRKGRAFRDQLNG